MRFYQVTLCIEGSAVALRAFQGQHLPGGTFSYNSAAQMPAELEFEMNNFVEDGYNALFGDWATLSRYWMLKEAAASKGFCFPLEHRAHVVSCIEALGEPGEERLRLGRVYKANLERFGYGHAHEWRKAHWGTEFDIFDVVVESGMDLTIRFVSQGPPARKVLELYSAMHPELSFAVSYHEQGRIEPVRVLSFKGGRAVRGKEARPSVPADFPTSAALRQGGG